MIFIKNLKGYLASVNSRSDIADPIPMASSYKVGMSRESYDVTSGSGCGASTTSYFHHAVNKDHAEDIAVTIGTENNTEAKAKINEYEEYLNSVDFGMTYETMLDMVLNNTMEAFYNEFKEKNDAIVEYVGGLTTFNKLFSDYADKVVFVIYQTIPNDLKSCCNTSSFCGGLYICNHS